MDIRCPSCSKLFRVADEKIAGKGIRFKCSKCTEVITITKDDFEMDLLARETDATETAPQQTLEPASRPSPPASPEPSSKPATPQTQTTPEPEAREYHPPQDPDIPPAGLTDFDFSEPHAAAAAAAHPEEGFGGQDFSFNVEPDGEAAPEVDISPEAAAEAEAALQFPDDLISEPTRKAAFGTPPAKEPQVAEDAASAHMNEQDSGPELAPQSPRPPSELQAEDDIDLGAALAMPKEPATVSEANTEPGPAAGAPQPKGPVITPELLAEMMKRSTSSKSAAESKPTSHVDEDMDLGSALAMPKTANTAEKEGTKTGSATAATMHDDGPSSSGKRAVLIGAIVLVLVAALAVLYYLGFLPGKKEPDTKQKPQQTPQTRTQPDRSKITPEGLAIADPSAFIDPERGDIVITGRIQNTTDRPKIGWYLVIEVRDAKEMVLTTARMLNGIQLYSKTELEALVKRGGKLEELQKKMASPGEGAVSPKGSVPFEVRVMDPPAGSARFLPTLQSFDTSSQAGSTRAGQGHP